MTRWRHTAIIVGVAVAALNAAAPSFAAQQRWSSSSTDLSARRHERYHVGAHAPPYEPRYYARSYYYRPYPYGVSYPFVLGFGPWWR